MPTFFGDWMKAERNKRGWTQQQMADVVELSKPQISRLEKGEQSTKVPTAVRIAQKIGADETDAVGALHRDADGAEEIVYAADPDSIPIPEGYNDDDPVIRHAATAAAQQAYKSIVDVLRDARKEDPGTTGFGGDRYSKQ